MVGLWLGSRKNRVHGSGTGLRAALPMPSGAGMLSCRVLDPVNQPVSHAEFTVNDAMGRKVVSGGVDPFGSFVATLDGEVLDLKAQDSKAESPHAP